MPLEATARHATVAGQLDHSLASLIAPAINPQQPSVFDVEFRHFVTKLVVERAR
jgi:hypothetical protein